MSFIKLDKKYFKIRGVILLVSSLAAFLFLFFGNNSSSEPELAAAKNIVHEKRRAWKEKNIPKQKQKKITCKIEKVKSPFIPDLEKIKIILIVGKGTADDDQNLGGFLSRASLQKRADISNVNAYHGAGKIYYNRALAIQKVLKNGDELSKLNPKIYGKIENKKQAEKALKSNLKRAQYYLAAVRPVPKYKFWSEALYFYALALLSDKKEEKAENKLQIIARTGSQALPARYSRFSLAIINFLKGNYSQVNKYLNLARRIKEKDRFVYEYIKYVSKFHQQGKNMRKFVKSFGEKYTEVDKIYYPVLYYLASYCVQKRAIKSCSLNLMENLKKKDKNIVIAWIYSELVKIKQPQKIKNRNIGKICEIYKGLK
ncbi:MAG: hypothetical protein PF689_00860 [Deltaproteobacteria bacterium]|nr:hypothetical protein [Deltaproteobacteria bacterium]